MLLSEYKDELEFKLDEIKKSYVGLYVKPGNSVYWANSYGNIVKSKIKSYDALNSLYWIIPNELSITFFDRLIEAFCNIFYISYLPSYHKIKTEFPEKALKLGEDIFMSKCHAEHVIFIENILACMEDYENYKDHNDPTNIY
jgi:hypothetical protein